MKQVQLTPVQADAFTKLLTPKRLNATQLKKFGNQIGVVLELSKNTGEINLRKLAHQQIIKDFIRAARGGVVTTPPKKRVETVDDLNDFAGATLTKNKLTNDGNDISVVVTIPVKNLVAQLLKGIGGRHSGNVNLQPA